MKKKLCLLVILILCGCTSMEQKSGYVCEMPENSETYSQTIDFDYNASDEVTSILFQSVLPAGEVSKDKLKETQVKIDRKYDGIRGAKATLQYDDQEELVLLESSIDMVEYDVKKDNLHIFSKEIEKTKDGGIHNQTLKKYLETEDVFKCIKK